MTKHANSESSVEHPSHYNMYEGIEIIELTEQMNFNKGNAVKYITRAEFKGKEIEDLEKAVFYLNAEIERVKRKEKKEAKKKAKAAERSAKSAYSLLGPAGFAGSMFNTTHNHADLISKNKD